MQCSQIQRRQPACQPNGRRPADLDNDYHNLGKMLHKIIVAAFWQDGKSGLPEPSGRLRRVDLPGRGADLQIGGGFGPEEKKSS